MSTFNPVFARSISSNDEGLAFYSDDFLEEDHAPPPEEASTNNAPGEAFLRWERAYDRSKVRALACARRGEEVDWAIADPTGELSPTERRAVLMLAREALAAEGGVA